MTIAIYGLGGFAREVLFTARERGPVVFASDEADKIGSTLHGREVVAGPDATEIVIAIADAKARRSVAETHAGRFTRLIAPTALVGPNVELGEGAILSDHTMITADAKIGRHFHCNIYAYVAHDCVIGDFVTFAPKVCCNGNIVIEDDAYIGTGAVLRQGKPGAPLRIGKGAVIGMGAVVTKDVPPGATVVGNPARPL